MATIFGQADQAHAAELIERYDAQSVRAEFESRYGRGWQRQLANNLGIAESTLSGWLKTGQVPKWASIAMGAFLHRAPDRCPWHAVKNHDKYEVYDFGGAVGRLIAGGISAENDALLIAAAPALRDACRSAWAALDDESNGDAISKIEVALDLAGSVETETALVSDGEVSSNRGLQASISPPRRPKSRIATHTLRHWIADGRITFAFDDGPSSEWALPAKADKDGIGKVRSEAIAWGKKVGATDGQVDAIKKALTSAGYHLRK